MSIHLENARVIGAKFTDGKYERPSAVVPRLKVPASCRVQLLITPSDDSHIESVLWLPESGWNGRLWSTGNGAFAGSIDEPGLTIALSRSYAVSATDTGHRADDLDAAWALEHPQKLIDFGFRAIHETAKDAKAIVAAYYGRPASFSYFSSSSNGGREALMEAQRFPDDYDGIEAGAPALDGARTIAAVAWMEQQLVRTPGAWIPPSKLSVITAAVMAACDELDGLRDGLIDDPRRCAFKPESLLCRNGDADTCLSAQQVASLKALYRGPGADLGDTGHDGFSPGGESGWSDWLLGSAPGRSYLYQMTLQFYRYLIYADSSWSLDRFDYVRDAPEAVRKLDPMYEAREPDLNAFAAHGGKLIVFHGWNDMAIPPGRTIDYYEAVRTTMGSEQTAAFLRLYMVPGLRHVVGGRGPTAFGQIAPPAPNASASDNVSAALIAWVEQGLAPQAIVAGDYGERGANTHSLYDVISFADMIPIRTRPLCPYPLAEHWTGHGSIDEAGNFVCAKPPPG
jgi:feruloyl esterase